MMKSSLTYRIYGRTNGWIAARSCEFAGSSYIVIEKGLTLKDAQRRLTSLFNEKFGLCPSIDNWGLIRSHYPHCTYSGTDGTRSFEYDSRFYGIELDDDDDLSIKLAATAVTANF